MRIVYSLPHPADTLAGERAGHMIRAASLMEALEELGHEVVRVEAASAQGASVAVGTYRNVVRAVAPDAAARRLRDIGRIMHARSFMRRLDETVSQVQPDAIVETHVVFATAGASVSRRRGVPLLLDDVPPFHESETQFGVGLARAARRARAKAFAQSGRIIVVNRVIRHEIVAEGVDNQKIAVIPNGVDRRFLSSDLHRSERRRALGIRDDEVIVGFVGSFQPFHRLDQLLDAFAELQTATPTRLMLVGDGENLAATREHATRVGIADRVIFTGRVPHDEVPSYVAAFDIATMPPTAAYTDPMKLYEYLAAGRATLAPRQLGVLEIVDETRCVLFDPGSESSMTAALQQLVDDSSLRASLGARAREVGAEHTWTSRAADLAAVIDACSRAGRGSGAR